MTPLHYGQYVHLDVLPNGDLRVTLTPEGVEELTDRHLVHPEWTSDMLLIELMEDITCNSNIMFLDDISTLDGGHLSQAPVIVEGWRSNDMEEPDYVDASYVHYLTNDDSKVWYWNEYMVISILEHIKRQGEAVLTQLT